jgi:hypothetical protein
VDIRGEAEQAKFPGLNIWSECIGRISRPSKQLQFRNSGLNASEYPISSLKANIETKHDGLHAVEEIIVG